MNKKYCRTCRWYSVKSNRCFCEKSEKCFDFILDAFTTYCGCYELNNSIDLNYRIEDISALLRVKDSCEFQYGDCCRCEFLSKSGNCIFGEKRPEFWELKDVIENLNKDYELTLPEVDNDEE